MILDGGPVLRFAHNSHVLVFSHSQTSDEWKSQCHSHPFGPVICSLYLNAAFIKVHDIHFKSRALRNLFHDAVCRGSRIEMSRFVEDGNCIKTAGKSHQGSEMLVSDVSFAFDASSDKRLEKWHEYMFI